MLVFVDESGDAGLKLAEGSTRYFVVTLVFFEEAEESNACYKRIELLKKELSIADGGEFKFSSLKQDKRLAFLNAVGSFQFFYYGIVINKEKLYGAGFKVKESFYKYACNLVFQNAKPQLRDAIVVIDGSGERQFRRELKTYLNKKVDGTIKKIVLQKSHSNNLIQLADMVAGSLHYSFKPKKDHMLYRNVIKPREMHVQVWPA